MKNILKSFAGILFCAAILAAQQTKYVVIVVLDGSRYSETFGDSSHQYIPHIWNDLRPQGTIYTSYYNEGRTETLSGHTSILSGTWQYITDDGLERSHAPSMFEYYRKQTGAGTNSCYVALGKTKLQSLANSDNVNYGAAYAAGYSAATSSSNDDLAFNNTKAALSTYHPKILLANIPNIDTRGHAGDWEGYLSSITHADSGVAVLWSAIQSDSILANKTTMIVTNDHGRHLDGISTGYKDHGDNCDGCRHILMLILGPDTKAGVVDTTRVRQIDIAPTVAAMLHFSVPLSTGKIIRSAMGNGALLNRSVIGDGSILTFPSDSTLGLFSTGTHVAVHAVAALGNSFTGWSGDITGTNNPDTLIMDSDKSITASFEPFPAGMYELRTEVRGSGSISQLPAGNQFSPDSKIALSAVPAQGNRFLGWIGDTISAEANITVTMTGHKLVTAEFEPIPVYPILLRECLHGSVQLTPEGGMYPEGTCVSVTAMPGTGWTFVEWTGDLNGGKNTDTVVVSRPLEIRPLFKKTAGGVYELPAKEDTYVRGGLTYSSKNFNNDPYLLVREGTTPLNQARTYLKFDGTAIKGNVEAAWLKLFVKQSGLPDGVPVKAHVYSVSDTVWGETILKYSGAPAPGTSMIDSTTTLRQAGKYYSWDVTSEFAAGKLMSFMVKDAAAGDKAIQFDKREGTMPPMLIVVTDQLTGVNEQRNSIPSVFILHQNFPNPFNPSTNISYDVPAAGHVRMDVYNTLGQQVQTLIDRHVSAGRYSVRFDGSAFPSGVYFYRIRLGQEIKMQKMVLMK